MLLRMTFRIHLGLVAVLAFHVVAVAQGIENDDLAAQARQLVRQLNAADLAVREQAEKSLMDLGPGVLPHLPPPDARMPAEPKQRLARVRRQLELDLAAVVQRASTITLQEKQIALSAVLEDLQTQSGNTIVDLRDRFGQQTTDPTIDVDFEETPFWQALDAVLDASGMSLYGFPGEGRLGIINAPPNYGKRSEAGYYAGPFRLEPTLVESRRDLRNPEATTLKVQMEAAWEPRMVPVVLRLPLEDFTALDENGGELPLAAQNAPRELSVNRGSSTMQFEVPFELPSRDVKKIGRLKGRLDALILGPKHTFEFTNLSPDGRQTERRGAVAVHLDGIRSLNENTWQAFLRVQFDETSEALQSHRTWVLNNPAVMQDAEGKSYEPEGQESTGQSASEVGVSFLFLLDKPLSEFRLRYETPTALLSLPVEFEMSDIELP